VRLRRSRVERGWEVLLRLTPRPLSARAWRTERFAGGLNATIAAAIVRTTQPSPADAFVDLMCGSGTLLLERLAAGPAARVVGIDVDPAALAVTRVHLRNARHRGAHVELLEADATALDEGIGRFDVLVANPPWGTLVGSHDENDALYPALLGRGAADARAGAHLGGLTHDVRRFESVLRGEPSWTLEQSWRFFQKGHHPRLYLLRLQ
jgi:23S rRNA G2445 N2-methylase RlmL